MWPLCTKQHNCATSWAHTVPTSAALCQGAQARQFLNTPSPPSPPSPPHARTHAHTPLAPSRTSTPLQVRRVASNTSSKATHWAPVSGFHPRLLQPRSNTREPSTSAHRVHPAGRACPCQHSSTLRSPLAAHQLNSVPCSTQEIPSLDDKAPLQPNRTPAQHINPTHAPPCHINMLDKACLQPCKTSSTTLQNVQASSASICALAATKKGKPCFCTTR